MTLFSVTVREHAYTGRFYHDVAEAASCEEALQLAAGQATAPQPPPGSKRRSFSVTVREHTYTGRLYHDVAEAGSCEEALQLAAGQATRFELASSKPQPDDANSRRCADVCIYSLLHCELAEGHDPPHMAVARGYWRQVKWVRDDRGLAHTLPEPATSPP